MSGRNPTLCEQFPYATGGLASQSSRCFVSLRGLGYRPHRHTKHRGRFGILNFALAWSEVLVIDLPNTRDLRQVGALEFLFRTGVPKKTKKKEKRKKEKKKNINKCNFSMINFLFNTQDEDNSKSCESENASATTNKQRTNSNLLIFRVLLIIFQR